MTPTALSPSQIAVSALALPTPSLETSSLSCQCGLCGQTITAGYTPAMPYSPPVDFASEQLHPRRAAWVCSDCSALLANPLTLTKYSRAVLTLNGGYRLTTAQDVGWLLLHAPAPLVAVFNTRKSAHMIWHTPVTYDKRAIGIAWAKSSAVIRTQRVQAAYEALARLSKHYNSKTRANYTWPVEGLSLRDDNIHMCQLLPSHEHLLRRSDEPAIQADLDAFDSLNQCERWALSAILLTAPNLETCWENLEFQQPPNL